MFTETVITPPETPTSQLASTTLETVSTLRTAATDKSSATVVATKPVATIDMEPVHVLGRLKPIMLKNLPIIPSRTSQKFYQLFLIYSQIITYYSFIIPTILLGQ